MPYINYLVDFIGGGLRCCCLCPAHLHTLIIIIIISAFFTITNLIILMAALRSSRPDNVLLLTHSLLMSKLADTKKKYCSWTRNKLFYAMIYGPVFIILLRDEKNFTLKKSFFIQQFF